MRERGDSSARLGPAALLDALAKGRAFRPEVDDALVRLLRVPVGREGMSRVFQPGFPGVRTFVVAPRIRTDGSVEIQLVGIARDGTPSWTGSRTFARGRDGGLELSRGFDEVEPEFRSRNITADAIRRELDLLASLDPGPSARLTVDAEAAGRYVCALHGFVFADETIEGPSSHSNRPRDRTHDRERLRESAQAFVRRMLKKKPLDPKQAHVIADAISDASQPQHFANLPSPGWGDELPEIEAGHATSLGRAFLLDDATPAYRAAAYARGEARSQRGTRYRMGQSARAEARLAEEVQSALDDLAATQRPARLRALNLLGQIAPSWTLPELRMLSEDPDRRIAALSKQVVRQISGSDLGDRLLAYAKDDTNSGDKRGFSFRVLAEYFPSKINDRVSLLRVDPDARIQRAVIPMLAESSDPAPELGTMLAANPWDDENRPGLLELRLELIDRLAVLADTRTLPVLAASMAAQPPPEESLALSRALIAHPDPRARLALTSATQSLDTPPVP